MRPEFYKNYFTNGVCILLFNYITYNKSFNKPEIKTQQGDIPGSTIRRWNLRNRNQNNDYENVPDERIEFMEDDDATIDVNIKSLIKTRLF